MLYFQCGFLVYDIISTLNYFIKINEKTIFIIICPISLSVCQKDNIKWSGFPTTSGKTPLTSGFSDWQKRNPHIAYICRAVAAPHERAVFGASIRSVNSGCKLNMAWSEKSRNIGVV